ncbi:biotin/lipoyl-containing protein [Mangrovimonas sp. YM274]|uniref:biotin/lipoyl-containing protein n=1 Tax=Mangrovimonas sp. YM274 TaxID=3070660 RepID=UPI0027DD83E2|nr:biotin/lipoyl-containing protein [Mangrovimonas sp. YM274]WMI70297.1 biotin/lipoyl-containing protein [Mangrovimonas sp. YM274]
MKNFTFNINKNSYKVKIISQEENTINLEVNGTSYAVELEQEIKKQKTPVLARRSSSANKEKPKVVNPSSSNKQAITAPIPGVILALNVKVGDQVKENDQLLILEAMKMENSIMADKSGVVSAVHVTVGKQVLQGDALIEIE